MKNYYNYIKHNISNETIITVVLYFVINFFIFLIAFSVYKKFTIIEGNIFKKAEKGINKGIKETKKGVTNTVNKTVQETEAAAKKLKEETEAAAKKLKEETEALAEQLNIENALKKLIEPVKDLTKNLMETMNFFKDF
jgi:hypothetical protein